MQHSEVWLDRLRETHGHGQGSWLSGQTESRTLDSILRRLPLPTDPNVLVGFSTNDDAGVYLINDDLALVQTVDFFTPVVDDPFTFGQIAAANSLSDIYAMAANPSLPFLLLAFRKKEIQRSWNRLFAAASTK